MKISDELGQRACDELNVEVGIRFWKWPVDRPALTLKTAARLLTQIDELKAENEKLKAKLQEQEPVEPLLLKARKIAADYRREMGNYELGIEIEVGRCDGFPEVQCAYHALKSVETSEPTEPAWIEWNGGECPVPDGSDCEVWFRDGAVLRDSRPEWWRWSHDGGGSEIIRYRVWPSKDAGQ